MFSMIPKTLIVYSNPSATLRLRLDKEHREVERIMAKYRLPSSIVERIHAASFFDIAAALRDRECEVIFFSGHGNEKGIILESESNTGSTTSWRNLASLLKETAPNLSVIVINACYSAAAEKYMLSAAPFLITIEGAADDDAAISFSTHFIEEFYRSTSIDQAFRLAVIALDATGKGDLIKPVLLRRPTLGKAIIEAIFAKRQDSLRIDIEEAESSIAALPIPRHDFLSLLSRKIQVHQWIFRSPREKAMLPIGSFLGVFSWQNANDVVVCHNILQLRTPLDPSDCLGWTRLLVTYNDLRSDRYRSLPNPAAPENKSILSQMLHSVERCYTNILKDQSVNDVSQRYTPQQYAVTMAAVEVHCERAKENFANDSLPDVVVSIEIAISAIHTLVDALTESLTIHE